MPLPDRDIFEIFLETHSALEPSEVGDAPGHGKHFREIKRVQVPDMIDACDQESVDAARRRIAGALDEYMDLDEPAHMLLIKASPGIGKTFAGVKLAHDIANTRTGKRVFYAAPRHDFFLDVTDASRQQGLNTSVWYEWLPRQMDQEDPSLNTCLYVPKIEQWMRRGYRGIQFCAGICGWDYVTKHCPYHMQKARKEPIIFGQHAHVVLGHPLADQFTCVIGDELPLSVFFDEWTLPSEHIYHVSMDPAEPVTHILYEMQKLCQRDTRLHGPDLYSLLGVQDVIDACSAFSIPAGALVLAPRVDRNTDISTIPYNFMPRIVPLMLREAQLVAQGDDFPHRVWLHRDGLTVTDRRYVHADMPRHVVWFDATGRQEIYEIMFGRPVDVVEARPKMAGKIYQVCDRANGKSSLVANGKGKIAADRRKKQSRDMVRKIAESHASTAVITFKDLLEAERFSDGIEHVASMHFYANRGSNAMQECDALIVLGTPQPPLYQIEKVAKALWYSRDRPFDQTWRETERAYQYVSENGEGYAYPISEFADKDLNTVLWQYREAEILQAAHRARPLHREVDVYLLTNLPIDELPPNEIVTVQDIMGAPSGLDPFKWESVIASANEIFARQGMVRADDLIGELNVSRATALKYMELLQGTGEWEEALVKPRGRGRPSKVIQRHETECTQDEDRLF